MDGDISSESEINAGNPELEMTATESVVRVDLELRAPLNTNSENNNENKGKPSFNPFQSLRRFFYIFLLCSLCSIMQCITSM